MAYMPCLMIILRWSTIRMPAHFSSLPKNTLQECTLIRINKALADAGICSRRKAETLVAQGLVSVNGQTIVDLATKVDIDKDAITVGGVPITTSTADRTYIMLYKPVQIMCTSHDPEGRTTIMDILPAQWQKKRLYSVGRLDYFSEGLLILTDDGVLAHALTHPRHHCAKVYEVCVRENVTDAMLTTMRRGMTLEEGEKLAPVGVSAISHISGHSTTLRMTLHQGVNRQIRRMCRDMQLTPLRLTRIAQGPLSLGNLTNGTTRELSQQEVAALRHSCGLA